MFNSETSNVLLYPVNQFPLQSGLNSNLLNCILFCQGGSGKRKITSLPQGTQGYTGKIPKTSSNSGKYVLYIVPLQESLDLRPLAHTAVEFHKMPKHPCMACRSEIPLPLLPHHIKLCNVSLFFLCCFYTYVCRVTLWCKVLFTFVLFQKDEPDLIDDDDEDDAEDTAAAKDVNDDVIAMVSFHWCFSFINNTIQENNTNHCLIAIHQLHWQHYFV